jgi:hypothetical protein
MPKSASKSVPEGSSTVCAEGGADVLFVSSDGAELNTGAGKRYGGSEAGTLEIFGAELDVGAEFDFDVGLQPTAIERELT